METGAVGVHDAAVAGDQHGVGRLLNERAITRLAGPHRFLHLFRGGDILSNACETVGLAVLILDGKAAVADPSDVSIGAHDSIFLVVGQFRLTGGGNFDPLTVIRMYVLEPEPRVGIELSAVATPDGFEGGTEVDQFLLVRRYEPKGGIDMLGKLPESFLALENLFCHPLAIAHVADHREYVDDVSRGITQWSIRPFADDAFSGLRDILIGAVSGPVARQ